MSKVLWSPWRHDYIKSFSEGMVRECLFCRLAQLSDDYAYILYRGNKAYVVLNAYPYNSGHLMIAPYRHVASIDELDDEELIEVAKLVRLCINVLKKALKPDGLNIGVNIGRAAGAGVEGHVHVHVVPRWIGDSNFMPITSGYKPLPIALTETYGLLKEEFKGKSFNSISKLKAS